VREPEHVHLLVLLWAGFTSRLCYYKHFAKH